MSIIGYGDSEMIRDRHNIFEISHGGKADLNVRTQYTPDLTVLTKEATLIDADEGIWQLSIGRDDAPGFYSVDSIVLPTADDDAYGFEIHSETRGKDLTSSDGTFVPSIANQAEAEYSRYQTAVVQFIDIVTETAALTEGVSKQNYAVRVLYMPSVATLQDYFNKRSVRNPNADLLIRAPVPAFVSVSLKIRYTDNDETPNSAAIKAEIANKVNALQFSAGKLNASVIFNAAHSMLSGPDAAVVSPIDIACTIRRPDGTEINSRSSNEIDIPDDPENGVTQRTTSFYLETTGIDIELLKENSVQV